MNTDRFNNHEEGEEEYSRPSFLSHPYLSDLDAEGEDNHNNYHNYYHLYGDEDEDGNPEWCLEDDQCFEDDLHPDVDLYPEELYPEEDLRSEEELRSDEWLSEEVYVDDQSCSNCRLCGDERCPMYINDYQSPGVMSQRMKRRKEDAEFRNGRLSWCIYWKGNPKEIGRQY